MFNSKSIQGIVVLILGIFLAVWLGLSIVTNQSETLIQIVTAIGFITCLALGRKIWLLIPFMTALDVELRLPSNPTSLLLAQVLFIGFSIPLFLIRKLPFRLEWTELEGWMLALTLLIVQVYMRNPVGVNIFGGDTVGGKGYVLYAIALAAAALLAGLRPPPRELNWALRLSIIGGLGNTVISILGLYVPAIGFLTGASFSRSDEVNYENIGKAVDTGGATRVGYFLGLGNNMSLWISSYISPVRALMRPLWSVLVLLTVAFATLGGYRNGVAIVGLTFLIGIMYRSGFSGIVLAVLGAIGGVTLLAAVNLFSPLPPNVQRSLTFLPGTWEKRYVDDAKGSSDWRFDIWKEVLTSDKWIHNKLLGDGLGFTAQEYSAQINQRKGSRSGLSGFDEHRETILVNGDYHSGPVSTIRVIGYIGLAIFLIASIRLAVHGHRQIIRCKGTEWLPLALFNGIHLITSPLVFVLLFGDFKLAAATFLLSSGMTRLIENNLPLPAYAKNNSPPLPISNIKYIPQMR